MKTKQELEQDVLNECAKIPTEWLKAYLGFSLSSFAKAELARRGIKQENDVKCISADCKIR